MWLAAVERYGRNVNASILGEYWLSFVIPNWVEYGTGKTNLRAGLVPPLSGDVDNTYKNSNGCWIRSELWACLAPGHPEIATRYAFEDAIVDHADEGMYAEIFTSAIQSAAFVENDREKLVEIGLSYLPENCITAQTIRKAVDCYHSGVDFSEARNRFIIQHLEHLAFRESRLVKFRQRIMREWNWVQLVLTHRRMWHLLCLAFYMEKAILERVLFWQIIAARILTVRVQR